MRGELGEGRTEVVPLVPLRRGWVFHFWMEYAGLKTLSRMVCGRQGSRAHGHVVINGVEVAV